MKTKFSEMRTIKELLNNPVVGSHVAVQGWVRTRRDSGSLSFVEISDGSCLANLQVVAEESLANYDEDVKSLTTGCAVKVVGELVASPAKGQAVELKADQLQVIGLADADSYPLQKKRHSLEFLRTISHLRSRTNALGAVTRVRSTLNFGIHQFFQENGFFQVQTPVITTSDCEGAGEMFTVTALEPDQLKKDGAFADDFFHKRAGLTVSGQLQAEIFALSHSRVYTFGPTFRAENSNTSRHLAEFWMLEPEMAFCDLQCNMQLAEAMIKDLIGRVLEECAPDLDLFNKFISKGLLNRLETIKNKPFVHLSYTDAVKELEKADKQFEFPVKWGIDLQAEHERYLCEEVAGVPVIVTNYPKKIKPFYMRLDDGEETVAAMDILVPGIGELVGGSQREERYDFLKARMEEAGLDLEEYGWYLDLRRYGTVPHSGFGLGFERLVQLITGMQNIRDVIPFPRTPGNAPC
ncbi:asparagine--tRNA ligase [Desulfogranum marinum]|uniref:asparagine--tRNA ligase n=1 Tax=Desulfogranum marinum TaxID=453220 RepID=UPI0029C67BE8|nr:asparagine--tRNA ligase [Desulfogranum marinum]